MQHYNRLPDAMIVEGAKAGGHLGISKDEIPSWDDETLLQICIELVQLFKGYEKATGKHIPVIAAGGIFDGKDVAKYLNAGIEGVQIATKFLATEECDAPEAFKQAVIDSKKEDMLIIDSPVGLPGRVIRNKFVEKIMDNEKIPVSCPYHCLKTCKPDTTPFCIAEALVNAQEGDIDNGIIMAGYNAYKLKAVVPVKTLVDELVRETIENIK